MKRILFITTLLFAVIGLQAQELTVKKMEVAPMDLSASTQPRNDLNGNPCALVKVQLPAQGAKFEGNVIGNAEYNTGEYWVYMSEGSYMLQVKHPNFYPLMINFRDYDIRKVESKVTYIMTIGMIQPNILVNEQKPIAQSQQSGQQSQQPVEEKPQPVVVEKDGITIETYMVNGVSFNMVRVKGGTFPMGVYGKKIEGYRDWDDNSRPIHDVTVSDFSIGETEVTQDLWRAVMGTNPSTSNKPTYPVNNVSYEDCEVFIKQLNSLTGRNFRLPTEAEWEFAACGGLQWISNSRNLQEYKPSYSGHYNENKVAWFKENSGNSSHPVKKKLPNKLGLYDMSGNVKEWCSNWYYAYGNEAQTDPTGPSEGTYRVCRGGSWRDWAWGCEVSFRDFYKPSERRDSFGLRLALSNTN